MTHQFLRHLNIEPMGEVEKQNFPIKFLLSLYKIMEIRKIKENLEMITSLKYAQNVIEKKKTPLEIESNHSSISHLFIIYTYTLSITSINLHTYI